MINRILLLLLPGLLVVTLLLARQNTLSPPSRTYGARWKSIDSLTQKGLFQSALTQINSVYERARNEKNHPQLVKASIGRGTLLLRLDPAQWPAHINTLARDTGAIPEPARSVLQSVLGDAYVTYYQRNRYRLYDRSRVSNPDNTTDLETWEGPRLARAATQAYQASLVPAGVLQATPLSAYAPVVQPGSREGEDLRPTLFDLLAHRAITFFQNTEFETQNQVFRFELDRVDHFDPAGQFADLNLTVPPGAAETGRMLALQTYQQLLAFHTRVGPERTTALADADLGRLRFVRQYSTLTAKDSLYAHRLEQERSRWQGGPAQAVYTLALAQLFAEGGQAYHPFRQSAPKWANKRAAGLSRDLVRQFPKTRSAEQARQLLDQLLAPSVSLAVEAVTVPEKPFLARLQYRNVPRIHYRLYKLTPGEWLKLGQLAYNSGEERSKQLTGLLKKPVAVQGSVSLPDDGDLNQHAVELPVEGLALGQYVLLISDEASFGVRTGQVALAPMTVSRLGYFINNPYGTSNSRILYVTSRSTGEPQVGLSVQMFRSVQRPDQEIQAVPGEAWQTDAGGRVLFTPPANDSGNPFYFRIQQGEDVLYTESQYNYVSPRTAPATDEQKALLFTDRAIYRPGQLIYVKGLRYQGRQNEFNVVAGEAVTIFLRDANGEELNRQTLQTNEFGSFTATFTAPTSRLTGAMTIACAFGQTPIRVEEYKRPTFAVTADTVREVIRLRQPVLITARAKTFAGAAVDGATVRYRVTRTYEQPYWGWRGWGSSSWPPRPSIPTEIANGLTTTDPAGVISLSFVATPDETIPESAKPMFTFAVTLEVTDQTGETRSATQQLRLGYTALQVQLTIPSQLTKGESESYRAVATNQSGEAVALSEGEVRIYRLEPPARQLRPRLWERPDRQLLSEAAFKAQFAYDSYAEEENPLHWPRVLVLAAKPTAFSLRTLAAGDYYAEASVTGPTGETASQAQFFSVVDEQLASQRFDSWVRGTAKAYKPGEEAVFFVGNNQPGWVLMTVDERDGPLRYEWLKTDGTPRRVVIPITERQRGGFAVHFARVLQGRLLTERYTVEVPFSNKQLTLETSTFRGRLKPGQAEEWTLRISGPGNSRVDAELGATLYDASLDAFVPHNWQARIYEAYEGRNHSWQSAAFGEQRSQLLFYQERPHKPLTPLQYPVLWPGPENVFYGGGMPRMASGSLEKRALSAEGGVSEDAAFGADASALNEVATVGYGESKTPTDALLLPLSLRTNFNETAFFFPQLKTDAEGRVLLRFTMPDALTRWKLLTFAHTKDLKIGLLAREIVTQKELMISLNPPRSLREGDTLQLDARINNLTSQRMEGTARLVAFDALTGAPLSQSIGLLTTPLAFSAGADGSTAISWKVYIPTGLPSVAFRVSATAGTFADAEERVVPVLPNRLLITDALPFWVDEGKTRVFSLSALTALDPSGPVQHERLTLEVTDNPVWTALQSLPYLMDSPYEGAEQVVSRLYANALAASLINSRPEFRRVVDRWAAQPPSNPLSANAELKSVMLENSPWLSEAKSEAGQTARLAQLLDNNKLVNEQRDAIEKLRQLQLADGGFGWFKGMPADLTMTLHVLSVMSRIESRFPPGGIPKLELIHTKAVQFADKAMKRWVADHRRQKNAYPAAYLPVQYLYARTLFQPANPDKATVNYLRQLVANNWLGESLQGQALAVLGLARLGDQKTARAILASLTERAKQSEELGMYWPQNQPGTFWYQTPIETQAYLIDAFAQLGQDGPMIQQLKKWLLRQKQTQSWPSTKATTEAVYALLQGRSGRAGLSDWLATGPTTEVSVGGNLLRTNTGEETRVTGYRKVVYGPGEITPAMGEVQISKKPQTGPAWGALYWQHFEPMDKVQSGRTSLTIQKLLLLERSTANGPVFETMKIGTRLKPGDRLRIRLVIKTDRLMEYVHLKDSRASGFEPVSALSGYKYRNGLGYYEAPRDASTDFFISTLPIGTHVFEYELQAVQSGSFSAGVATIASFYAPAFSARSAGARVLVD